MLSTEKPSDPSCSSSKDSGLRGGQRDSGQVTLQDQADPALGFAESHTTNFSIRDYVFASRSRDISTSWPFPRESLQLCLKHGIRDFLPPFERASSSLRAHCLIKPVSHTEKVITNSSSHVRELVLLDGGPRNEFCSPSEDVLLRSSVKDDGRCLVEQDKSENLINDACEISAAVTNNCASERSEPVLKNCTLILEPGAISETSLAEEIASSSAASDLMASKVCPVCKAFSSTSNTTLNAHIDQCLSMESDTTMAVDKIPMLKVKPRKKRLMEDIYATALTCTLEDLDRRNGTSWATDLSLVAPNAEDNTEAKKPKFTQLDTRDENSEGAVYVDSNGIKLGILSKFNDAPQVISRDVFRPKKTAFTEVRDGKIILIRERKHSAATGSKKMKMKLRNKKSRSLKLSKDEIQAGPEVAHHEECHIENESLHQLSGEQGQAANYCESATLLRWPCSKRSDLLKKVGKKDFHKSLEHFKPVTQMSVLKPRKPASVESLSAAKYHCVKISRSPESKTVDFPVNIVQNKDNQEKISQGCPSEGTSANVLHLKLSRASEALVSSPRSTAEEFCIGKKQKSHNTPMTNKGSSGSCHIPLKTKRISSFSELNYSTGKLCKHRSLLVGSRKRKKEFLFGSNSGQFRSAENAVMTHRDEQAADQSLHHVKTHCQDAKPRNTQMHVKSLGLDRVSWKADSSSLAPNSIVDEDQGLLLESNDKTNAAIVGSEMPMVQVSLEEQDKRTPDELEHRGAESRAEGTSAQDFSACSTSYWDQGTDIPSENTSNASLIPNQENNLSISKETSGSPASNASTISPASSNDSRSKVLNSENASKSPATQERLSFRLPFMVENDGILGMHIERNQQVQIDYTAKKPQQLSDYQPCCCSCQSIMAGSMEASKPKSFPNLYIRPTISSSFGAYPGMRTDTANNPSLESPTRSILTRACSDVGSTSPSCGTPTQSSSNSILRLMGKDLMVVHNEESVQLPKVHPPATCNNSSVQGLPSPFGFASYASVPNHETFSFAAHTPSSPVTNLQARNCRPTVQQSNMNHTACMTKEVIVIDDSSDNAFAPRVTFSTVPVSHAMFSRPFCYFPPQGHLLPRENGFVPCYPISQGSSLEVPAPLLPRPLVFQSPSAAHLNSQFYYPQPLR